MHDPVGAGSARRGLLQPNADAGPDCYTRPSGPDRYAGPYSHGNAGPHCYADANGYIGADGGDAEARLGVRSARSSERG